MPRGAVVITLSSLHLWSVNLDEWRIRWRHVRRRNRNAPQVLQRRLGHAGNASRPDRTQLASVDRAQTPGLTGRILVLSFD